MTLTDERRAIDNIGQKAMLIFLFGKYVLSPYICLGRKFYSSEVTPLRLPIDKRNLTNKKPLNQL